MAETYVRPERARRGPKRHKYHQESQERRNARDLELLNKARAAKIQSDAVKTELSKSEFLMRRAEEARRELESRLQQEEAEKEEYLDRVRRLRMEALEAEASAAKHNQSAIQLRSEVGDREREQGSHAAKVAQASGRLAKLTEELRIANAELGL